MTARDKTLTLEAVRLDTAEGIAALTDTGTGEIIFEDVMRKLVSDQGCDTGEAFQAAAWWWAI